MAYEYLFASLPVLPQALGEEIKLTPSELHHSLLSEGGEVEALGAALLLYFDIKALERIERGVDVGFTARFSGEALEDRTTLPPWIRVVLDASVHEQSGYAFDVVWRAYYKNLLELSNESSSGFMKSWIEWDIGLRNAIAEHRAAKLSMNPESYLFDFGISEKRNQFKPIVESLTSMEERGVGTWRDMDKLVGETRIEKVQSLAPAYTFDLDELMGYTVQYIVYKEFEYL